ncbi:MAG: site-2 protease family protein [Candidatus Micrarchaeia archaeon]
MRKTSAKPIASEIAKIKALFAAICLTVSIAFFLMVLDSPLSAILKFILCALCLAACGTAVAFAFNMESWGGLILLKSNYGLSTLDKLAKKHPKLWQQFAEIGMVVAYGSLAYFVMGKKDLRKDWKSVLPTYAIGTILLILLSGLIPIAMSTLLSMVVGGDEFATAGSKLSASVSQFAAAKYISLAFMIIGGISLVTTSSILVYAGVVGFAVFGALTGNAEHLANTSPGGMPILPGINLDLIQGAIGLAIILAVHEGMHGILARLYNLPLKSAGLVLFGFLPFGAFVDIDEKKLFSAPKEKQNAVLVAGTAANFAAALVFLAAFILFVSAMASIYPVAPAWAKWLAKLLALTFSLNTIVAAINLVPLPLFDGYHIMRNAVGSKRAATAITWIVAAAFLLTMFPWVLR